ncbi:MAG TPA: hypothetical protein VGH33_00690 [Isosphaeraceae bacterium]
MSEARGAARGGARPARRRLRDILGRAVMLVALAVAMLGIAGRDLQSVTLAVAISLALVPVVFLLPSSAEVLVVALVVVVMFWFLAPGLTGKPPGWPGPAR